MGFTLSSTYVDSSCAPPPLQSLYNSLKLPLLYRRRRQRCPKPTGSSERTRLRSRCVGLADVWGQLVDHTVGLGVRFMTRGVPSLPSLPSPPPPPFPPTRW